MTNCEGKSKNKNWKKTDTMMISYNKKYNFSDDIYKEIKKYKKILECVRIRHR